MSRLASWLLIPPVSSRLSDHYRHYRRHGASAFSAAFGCFWMILAWMFIPLEHPAGSAFVRDTVNCIRTLILTVHGR